MSRQNVVEIGSIVKLRRSFCCRLAILLLAASVGMREQLSSRSIRRNASSCSIGGLTIIAPDLSSDAERLAIVVDHRVEIAHVNQVFKEVKLNRGSKLVYFEE